MKSQKSKVKSKNHNLKLKSLFLPFFALLFIGFIYFGVNGVKAELNSTAKQEIKKETLSDRPLNIVAIDNNKTPNVENTAVTESLKPTQIEQTPKVRNFNRGTPEAATQKVTLRISAGNAAGNYPVDYYAHETAYNLLLRIAKTNNFTISAEDYGSMGMLVVGIGNLTNTPDVDWFYYINGKIAEIGASTYQVKPDDLIEWRYHEWWIY